MIQSPHSEYLNVDNTNCQYIKQVYSYKSYMQMYFLRHNAHVVIYMLNLYPL